MNFKIGDRIFVRGYIDEIRKDTVIIRNTGGYFGTDPSEVITGELPSAQAERTCVNCGRTVNNGGWYADGRTRSCCGYKNPFVKNLSIREWECPNCHAKHDRDTNASINILNKGLSLSVS